jgi:hypothetical protein
MEGKRSPWASRFIGATFVLGAIAWATIAVLVLGNVLAGTGNYLLGPASSRIVAGAGPGSWFTMGLLAYLLIGIAGVGMSALFYQHVEATLGAPLTGWRNIGAAVHLLLGGGGAAAASLLMTYAGFQAGAAALATNLGGGGHDTTYIHTNILSPVVLPIAALMGVALLGYLVGGIVLTTAWMKTPKM